VFALSLVLILCGLLDVRLWLGNSNFHIAKPANRIFFFTGNQAVAEYVTRFEQTYMEQPDVRKAQQAVLDQLGWNVTPTPDDVVIVTFGKVNSGKSSFMQAVHKWKSDSENKDVLIANEAGTTVKPFVLDIGSIMLDGKATRCLLVDMPGWADPRNVSTDPAKQAVAANIRRWINTCELRMDVAILVLGAEGDEYDMKLLDMLHQRSEAAKTRVIVVRNKKDSWEYDDEDEAVRRKTRAAFPSAARVFLTDFRGFSPSFKAAADVKERFQKKAVGYAKEVIDAANEIIRDQQSQLSLDAKARKEAERRATWDSVGLYEQFKYNFGGPLPPPAASCVKQFLLSLSAQAGGQDYPSFTKVPASLPHSFRQTDSRPYIVLC